MMTPKEQKMFADLLTCASFYGGYYFGSRIEKTEVAVERDALIKGIENCMAMGSDAMKMLQANGTDVLDILAKAEQ